MQTVRSTDGTVIAFEVVGEGPPVIVVMGAFGDPTYGRRCAG